MEFICLFVDSLNFHALQTPYVPGDQAPRPSPAHCLDVWDQYHVKMPNSARSHYNDPNGVEISRWELIERTLLTPMHSFHDLRVRAHLLLDYYCLTAFRGPENIKKRYLRF